MLTFLSLSALAATPSWSTMQSTSGWKHLTTRKHRAVGPVAVSWKRIAGIDCYEGKATTDVPAASMLEVAMDIPSHASWSSAGVTEGAVLARNGERIEYYQFLDMPAWTMSNDRFWFMWGEVERGDDQIAFHWDRLEGGGDHASRWSSVKARHSGAIEPPVNTGAWVFTPSTGQVRYLICSDAGGTVPAAVQSAATRKALPDTVGELVGEARRRSR